MKKQEIKKLSKDEILKNIDKFKKDLFNFRFQKINSQVTNPSKINETKITIVSPILAYLLFDPPKTLIHSILFAPVLSATFNSV